ncbi:MULTISPECIES: hypothetical protein [unclassified Rhizobium]|uniref:hypothetical protein n=1 Tax=unclassified Rhizobium TaxID=2613769 RepID=UPI001ADAAEAB|nr:MULTISPECIES: hypothetical protein [unclassified Rhizobium]MBO9099437.1 hypothetical protein [Rhizobium sp. L58/93]QXZ87077.1 hypothetical protein J5287_21050 [Rhizobium sp. K1/93]QXZ92889.1 hypothetical protein J5280_19845 [Rhizobium sp. K15/93]
MYVANMEPVSNREDWFETIELINDDTNEIITDLTGITAKVYVRDRDRRSRILSGTTEDGHIVIDPLGVIQWHFTAAEMSNICAGTYDIGFTVERDDIVQQELIGTLPVVDGIMR